MHKIKIKVKCIESQQYFLSNWNQNQFILLWLRSRIFLMDLPREERSTNRPPLLKDTIIHIGKQRREFSYFSLAMKTWASVSNGWEPLVPNDKKLKKIKDWSPIELELAKWNFKDFMQSLKELILVRLGGLTLLNLRRKHGIFVDYSWES